MVKGIILRRLFLTSKNGTLLSPGNRKCVQYHFMFFHRRNSFMNSTTVWRIFSFVIMLGMIGVITPNIMTAQGQSAVPFLLIAPNARADGMGEAGGALADDAPQHIGIRPDSRFKTDRNSVSRIQTGCRSFSCPISSMNFFHIRIISMIGAERWRQVLSI